jgi:hypothetical protein
MPSSQYSLPASSRATSTQRQANQILKTRATATSHCQPWTDEELEKLQRDDLTVPQMAELLGRTYRTTANRLQRLRRSTA